jgi:hypothetical protein
MASVQTPNAMSQPAAPNGPAIPQNVSKEQIQAFFAVSTLEKFSCPVSSCMGASRD